MLGLVLALPLGVMACGGEASGVLEGTAASIIGGEIAQTDSGVVLVRADGVASCTGEVVSPHVVTTAAHCISGSQTWSVDTSYDGSGRPYAVGEAHSHPSYEGTLGIFDVGVLILNDALPVTPIAVSHSPLTDSDIGKRVRIVGYGDTTVYGEGFGKRRQAMVALVSYTSGSVTVGNVGSDGKVQCYGDSGGPALLTIDGVERIIGFDSGGQGSLCNRDDINTRADAVTAFIDPYIHRFN
jgi:secreted trypsin-like serine protease